MNEREIDVWSAEWLGHKAHNFHDWSLKRGLPVFWDGMWVKWNPRHSLDDARLLLEECKRQGLLNFIADKLWDSGAKDDIIVGLFATAKQITQAVWEVAQAKAAAVESENDGR